MRGKEDYARRFHLRFPYRVSRLDAVFFRYLILRQHDAVPLGGIARDRDGQTAQLRPLGAFHARVKIIHVYVQIQRFHTSRPLKNKRSILYIYFTPSVRESQSIERIF